MPQLKLNCFSKALYSMSTRHNQTFARLNPMCSHLLSSWIRMGIRRRITRITPELITANCAEKTTENFQKKFLWQHLLMWINHLRWTKKKIKLDIRCGTSRRGWGRWEVRDEMRQHDPPRRNGAAAASAAAALVKLLTARDSEKRVCTTMTTKWQLIETWIINAMPHRKEARGPIVRSPYPAHCPFAFVASAERWPGKLPERMLTDWRTDVDLEKFINLTEFYSLPSRGQTGHKFS